MLNRLMVAVLAGLLVLGGVRAEAEQIATQESGSQPSTTLSLGTGLAVYSGRYSQLYNSGSVGNSITAGWIGQIGDGSFYWGLDFNLYFWGFSPSPMASGSLLTHDAVGIAPLFTLLYRFPEFQVPGLSPFLGVSAGPQLYLEHDRFTNATSGQATSDSDTTLFLQFMARPGLEYRILNSLAAQLELRAGLLGGSFMFQPMLGLSLLL